MKKQIIILCACLSFCISLCAQDITHAEYFIDVDPGAGNATNINGFPTNDTLDYSFSIPTTGLTDGFHTLGVRVKNEASVWSHYEKRVFYLLTGVISPNITAAEYFVDTDPGPGNGIDMIGFPTNDTLDFSFSIPAISLADGFHTLVVRVKDEAGVWSIFEKRMFYVNLPASIAPDIIAAEYFVNSDPGPGSGTPISLSQDDTLSTVLSFDIPESTILGTYYYGIRVKNPMQQWSLFAYDTLTVAFSLPQDTVVNAETGICARIVTMIDAETLNDQPYTYMLSGATSGSGNGSASGLSFNVGITTVTYALLNDPDVSASFTVTVQDNEVPMITCPANIVEGADAGICGAVINYAVSYSDNCPGAQLTLLSGMPSGSNFPLGITTNVYRVGDAAGNSATCSFTISITDDIPPSISCPANLSFNSEPDLCTKSNVTLGSPMTSDNCGVATVNNNAPSIYPVGITNVIWMVTDLNGLTASCVQTVTIIDNQVPVITCPANLTVYAGSGSSPVNVSYDLPSYSDNCAGAVMNQTTGVPSGGLFWPGITTNTFLVTDASGLTASCSFTVLVRVGRVGVNTKTPLAMLHVKDSSVLFTGPSTLPEIPSNPPQSISYSGLMWYPDKAAMRFGSVQYNRWSKDSIGIYSLAGNYNTLALGNSSVAFNYETSAVGDHALAIGDQNIAMGTNSFAAGTFSRAVGESSVSLGYGCTAIGNAAVAYGLTGKAIGDASFVSGNVTSAKGDASVALGNHTRSIGDQSASFGHETIAKAFRSFVIGAFNDSTAIETELWDTLDPLFIVGNGLTISNRLNALTVLKNGNTGLFERTPDFKLHVTNANAQSGGMNEGILIENTHALVGEAAISFRTKSIPTARKWIIGQNQAQTLDFNFYNSFVLGGMKMRMDTMGFIGIQKLVPKATLHVVRNDTSGGPYSSNAAYLFESNLISYLQLSSLNNHETGILSGNQADTLRSAIIFSADSSLHYATGGDYNRFSILKNGNTGIGSNNSDNKLYVAGNSKIGTNGTAFQQMLKYTHNITTPLMAAGDTYTLIINNNNFGLGGTVFMSPSSLLPQGLILTTHAISGFMEVRFCNVSTATIFPTTMDYYYVHIY